MGEHITAILSGVLGTYWQAWALAICVLLIFLLFVAEPVWIGWLARVGAVVLFGAALYHNTLFQQYVVHQITDNGGTYVEGSGTTDDSSEPVDADEPGDEPTR